jgi:cbb3-type cytochrome c oxidase subunit II
LRDEVERYGHYSLAAESMYDHPFQWGSKRNGPDLARVGGKYSNDWHIRHFLEPKAMVPGSIMPNYPHLVTQELDFSTVPARMSAMRTLGVPYTADEIENAEALARTEARAIVDEIITQEGPEAVEPGWETRKVVAVVAYLQRLGTDLYATPDNTGPAEAVAGLDPREPDHATP